MRRGKIRTPVMVLLVTGLFLAGCGGWQDSRVNPGNWFGKSRSEPVQSTVAAEETNPLIPRKPAIGKRPEQADNRVAITTVTELRVDRTTTGAIILVSGVAARQGAFNTQLRLDPPGDNSSADVLSYTLIVDYPTDPTPVGSEHTRTIHAARSLSNQDLRGIRLIRVKAEQNTIETRRR